MESVVEGSAVLVTNISASATEKTVSDFFSFCGKITKLFLEKAEGSDSLSALVQFETESAAKTALLLSNALIVDRPITVVAYSKSSEGHLPAAAPVAETEITVRNFGGLPDEQRSKTSVIISILAQGYVLAEDALDKAKDWDEKHGLIEKAQHALDQIKTKAQELDKKYKITEKISELTQQASDKATKLNEDFKLTEKASNTVNLIKTKASQNPTVSKGLSSLNSAVDSLTGMVNVMKEDTQRAIRTEKEKRKSAEVLPVNPPTSSSPPPSDPSPLEPAKEDPSP